VFLDGSRSASRLHHLPRRVPDQPIEAPHAPHHREAAARDTDLAADLAALADFLQRLKELSNAGISFFPDTGHDWARRRTARFLS
jgi:hypothetical protein